MSEFDTLVVEENDAQDLVVEENDAQDLVVEEEIKTLPGSDAPIIVEEDTQEMAAKDTDWTNDKDYSKFLSYLKDKLTKIPRHSGNTIPGCERAVSYLKDLQGELSRAMRGDLEGKIDEQAADDMYKNINDQVEQLNHAIDKLRTNTSTKNRVFAAPEVRLIVEGKCDKCECDVPTWHDVENDRVVCLNCEAESVVGLEKVANTPALNVVVSAFERAIIGTLMNASVSGGKNIEEMFDKLDKRYKFTDREKLSIAQLLSDYGMPIILDRAKLEENDAENDGEMNRNYHA